MKEDAKREKRVKVNWIGIIASSIGILGSFIMFIFAIVNMATSANGANIALNLSGMVLFGITAFYCVRCIFKVDPKLKKRTIIVLFIATALGSVFTMWITNSGVHWSLTFFLVSLFTFLPAALLMFAHKERVFTISRIHNKQETDSPNIHTTTTHSTNTHATNNLPQEKSLNNVENVENKIDHSNVIKTSEHEIKTHDHEIKPHIPLVNTVDHSAKYEIVDIQFDDEKNLVFVKLLDLKSNDERNKIFKSDSREYIFLKQKRIMLGDIVDQDMKLQI